MPPTTTLAGNSTHVDPWTKESFRKDHKYYIIGGIAGAIGLIIVIAFIVMVVALKRRMGTQSQSAGKMEAQNRIKAAAQLSQNQMYHHPVHFFFFQLALRSSSSLTKTDDFAALSKHVHEMTGPAVTTYMDSIIRKRKALPAKSNIEIRRVLDCGYIKSDRAKYPEHEIIECTQAPVVGQHIKEKDHWCLHANVLRDLYGYPFVVSQAPSKELFEFHWEVIWQERVGVIVWLSSKKSDGIQPYFGLAAGTEMNYGRFDIRTASTIRYRKMCTVYTLVLRNRNVFTTVDFRGQENREVLVIQIEKWPKQRKEANASLLALLVEMTRSVVLDQSRKHHLPGIWAHCTTGLEQSAAFYTMYVSRQMHYRFNSVNVKGTFRLIERMRYKSFHGDNAFEQVRIVHAVVAELIAQYGYEKERDDARSMADVLRKLNLGSISPKKSFSLTKSGSEKSGSKRAKATKSIAKLYQKKAIDKLAKMAIGRKSGQAGKTR